MLVHSNANYTRLSCRTKFSNTLYFYRIVKRVKVKVVPLHAMKVCGGQEVWLHSFLTLALDAVEWSVSRLDCFTARKRTAVQTELEAAWTPGTVGACFGDDKIEDKYLPIFDVI